MACFHPRRGLRCAGGQLRFPRTGIPLALQGNDLVVTVSCKQCRGCRLEYSRQWAVRLSHENKAHKLSSFVTLTYSDDHLPENGGLVLEHVQSFLGKLRKHMDRSHTGPPPSPKLRYFHCGEYGDTKGRPHYHFLLFGIDFHEDREKHKVVRGNQLYTSETLAKLWGKGDVKQQTIGSVTYQSSAYVARYIFKKINGDPAKEHYETVNTSTGEVYQVKPEYCTMSRRPGIGSLWIKTYHSDVYPSDEVSINGKHARPPSYYDTQYEIIDPKSLERVKLRRITKAKKHASNNSPARLRVREQCQIKKTERLKRTL